MTSPTSERERLVAAWLESLGFEFHDNWDDPFWWKEEYSKTSGFNVKVTPRTAEFFYEVSIAAQRSLLDKVEAEVIGSNQRQDEPFLTPNGGLSNMGPNNCRNKLREEQRTALAQLRKEIG